MKKLSNNKEKTMSSIFEFNHISKDLLQQDINTLKDLKTLKDKHYHKKVWCFKKSYKRLKLLDETITISGIGLMIIGTITGGITLNPNILGVINGSGIIVTNIGKMKNYKMKIKMTYQNCL